MHHFTAASRVADMNRILEIEVCSQRRQVVGMMIHVMAVPGLAGTPVAPPIVSNYAIAALAEEQHLVVPIVRRKWPAVAEHDGLTFAPVLVINLCSVLRCDRSHRCAPFHTDSRSNFLCYLHQEPRKPLWLANPILDQVAGHSAVVFITNLAR